MAIGKLIDDPVCIKPLSVRLSNSKYMILSAIQNVMFISITYACIDVTITR